MKLILTEDVPNLGSLGDTIEVKAGYGRNYLVPKGMALLATGKASKELRHRLQYLEKLRAGKIALANEQAEKLTAIKDSYEKLTFNQFQENDILTVWLKEKHQEPNGSHLLNKE